MHERLSDALNAAAAPHWPSFRDDATNLAARNALLLAYLPLADHAARKLASSSTNRPARVAAGLERDDLHALAFECLFELLREFDPSRNDSFTGYVNKYLRLRLVGKVRDAGPTERSNVRSGKFRQQLSIHDRPDGMDDGPTFLDQLRRTPATAGNDAEVREWIGALRDGLKGWPRLARLFELRFIQLKTVRECAIALGCCESSVHKMKYHELLPLVAQILARMDNSREIPDGVIGRLRELARNASHLPVGDPSYVIRQAPRRRRAEQKRQAPRKAA